MSSLAQFTGICAACDHRIVPGQWITPTPTGQWAHVTCPDDPDTTADQAALKVGRCTRCGLNHPGEC